jgi:hypothetical protein
MTSPYVRLGLHRLAGLLLITTLCHTNVLLAESNNPATPPKQEKAGRRTGTVIAIDTNNATFTLRPRVVNRGYTVMDESKMPKYVISYDNTTKFVHIKKGDVTIADLEINDTAMVSLYEGKSSMRATHVMLGMPMPGMLSRPTGGFSTNTTPQAVSTDNPADRP